MAGLSIIGRIGVRVYPDLTGFKQRLRAELKKIEKELDDLPIEVGLELDKNGLKNKVRAAVADAQRAADDINVDVDVDVHEKMRERLRDVDRMLKDAKRKLVLDLGVDAERADRELKRIKDKHDGDEIEFQAAVDSLVARAELARVARDRIVTLHVNVSKKSLAAASTAIAALSGARLAGDTVRRLWESLEDLDKAIPAISAVTTAILLLSAGLTTAVSNTLALFASLVQIGALALVLPGIATGFAVGFGATFAVFKDFNEVLPEVKERLAGLQDRMSERFWRKAKEPIRNFIDTLFPEFEEGMLGVSDSLGGFFGELADHLKEDLGGRMGGMFENLAESIDIATGATDALSGIITTLGEKGSEYLPRLAEWFKENMISFDQWIEEAAESGEFDRWIERAIENAGYLWDAVRDLSVIIYTLGVNAEEAGGSGLKQFAETMARVRDVVQSPGFLAKYRDFVQASHDFIQSISDGVDGRFVDFVPGFVDDLIYAMEQMGPAIGDVWGSIFEGLSTDGFREGFRGLFDGLAGGFEKLAPHIPGIVEGIGTLLGLIGTMAEQFLPIWGEVLELIADILKENAPVIEELIIALSDAFLELLRNHSDDIKAVFTSVMDFLVKLAPYAPQLLIAAGGFRLLAGAIGLFKGLGAPIGSLLKLGTARWGWSGLMRGSGYIALIVGTLIGMWNESERLRESVGKLGDALGRLGESYDGSWLQDLVDGSLFLMGEGGAAAVDAISQFVDGIASALEGDLQGDTSFVGIGLGIAERILGVWQSSEFKQRADEFWQALFGEERLTRAVKGGIIEKAVRGLEVGFRGVKDFAEGEFIPTAGRLGDALREAAEEGSAAFIDFHEGLEDPQVSLQDWIDGLLDQQLDQKKWIDNLRTLVSEGASEAVIAGLADLGPAGADMVAELVNSPDLKTQLEQLEQVFGDGGANSANSMIDHLVATLTGGSIGKVGEALARGLARQDFTTPGRNMGEAVRNGLSKVSMEGTGRSLASGFVKGFSAVSGDSSGRGLAGRVRAGLAAVDASGAGRTFASSFTRGVSGYNGASAGRSLANSAARGLSINTYTKGVSFARDFASGIKGSESQRAVRSAVGTIAGIAKGGLPGSPAEWGPLSGQGWSRIRGQHYTDDFAQGIRERRKAVVGAVEDVAKAASLQDKLKNGSRIAANLEMDQQHELRLADAPITLTVDGQQMSGYITQKVDARNAEEARRIRYGRGQ